MSRPYVIRVAETVRRHVVLEDGVEARLDVLEVLPAEDMTALLEEELTRRGFASSGGVATRVEAGGVVVRVDVAARKIHVGIREAQDLEVTVERAVRTYEEQGVTEEHRATVRREGEIRLDAAREERRREVTVAIEQRVVDLRSELDDVVVKVTQEALRRRAGQLGEIQSIEEDAETGSLTIRVRV